MSAVADEPPRSLREALAFGQRKLGGGDAGAVEARILLAHAAGCGRAGLQALEAQAFTEELYAAYGVLVQRRAGGEPVSHILGYRDFWKHRFRVSRDVLDPRPETECLVAEALRAPFSHLLDLGTGSGAIVLSLLSERPEAQGLGVDISPAALAIAHANAEALGLAGRCSFSQSDWFSDVRGRFDLIVANPPYIAAAELAGLASEVRDWEPLLALSTGGDGLLAYRAIAARVARHLRRDGRLIVEIGPTQAQAVSGILTDAGLRGVDVLHDLDGRDRVISAHAPADRG